MTDWNNLEERYLSAEEIEILAARRKEIETRRKQDFLDRVIERTHNLHNNNCMYYHGRTISL